MDWLPTLASLVGGKLSANKIDGLSMKGMLLGEKGAQAPHEAIFFYSGSELHAVRCGEWKLHFRHPYLTVAGEPGRNGKPSNWGKLTPTSITQSGVAGIATRHGYGVGQIELSLFNLLADPGEQHNVAGDHPDIVEHLSGLAVPIRKELGDALQGTTGSGVRQAGFDP
jgi:arylsulfatase A-like enzyme